MNNRRMKIQLRLAALALIVVGTSVSAQTPALITQPVDEGTLVTLPGHAPVEVARANDLGRVADGLRMEHTMLQLQHSACRKKP